MRARNIKPALFKNEHIADLDPYDRLLFIGLWCMADREGRLEDRPKRIKMELFPCDNYDVEAGLLRLQTADGGLIRRYEVCGFQVISVTNFLKHQNPHGTEADSALPDEHGIFTVYDRNKNKYVVGDPIRLTLKEMQDNGYITVTKPLCNSMVTDTKPSDSLIPDSLIPDIPLPPTTEVMKQVRKTTRFVKPTVEEVAAYIKEKGFTISAQRFVDGNQQKGWIIGAKTPMKDWKAAVRTWQANEDSGVFKKQSPSTPESTGIFKVILPEEEAAL